MTSTSARPNFDELGEDEFIRQTGEAYFDDIPRSILLAGLWNNALGGDPDKIMTVAEAQSFLDQETIANDPWFFQELYGRTIEFNTEGRVYVNLYNNANGVAVERVVEHIRQTLTPELLAEATKPLS